MLKAKFVCSLPHFILALKVLLTAYKDNSVKYCMFSNKNRV